MRVTRTLCGFGALTIAIAMAPAAFAATTKLQANIVPTANTSSATLSPKGKFQMDSKGGVKVGVKFVCEAVAAPDLGIASCAVDAKGKDLRITTDASWDTETGGTLTGDEFAAVIDGNFETAPIDPENPAPTTFQVVVPIELKKGNALKGGKVNIVGLLGLSTLLGGGNPGSADIQKVEIWGPIGVGAAAGCQALIELEQGLIGAIAGSAPPVAILQDDLAALPGFGGAALVPAGDASHPCVPDTAERIGVTGLSVAP